MRRGGGGGGGGGRGATDRGGKPEPPLFELALSRMGVTADTAAMVGDSVDSDIRGAGG